MKRFLFFILTGAFCAASALAQTSGADAASIMRSARDRIQAETTSSRSRMVITAKNGSTTERVIDQYSKDDSKGRARLGWISAAK